VKKIDEDKGVQWLQNHLLSCCQPLLKENWILDVDTTVKPLYGHQEGANKGYNPQKPGRPSHTHHAYMMADLRLVLDVEVQSGDKSHSTHSLPGLTSLICRLQEGERPEFVRGDIAWGTDTVMRELEELEQAYLFKLKKSKNVLSLIYEAHGRGEWIHVASGWEAKEAYLQLQGWEDERRVIISRRRLSSNSVMGIEYERDCQQQLSLIDGPEDIKVFEYSVLVSNLDGDVVSIFHHYRDRSDSENNFDELKNQWGWSGYTTKDMKSCRLMSRMIALIYNWWNLYTRLAIPGQHHEAITSKPMLLSSVGRQTVQGNQKKIRITSAHGKKKILLSAYHRLEEIFSSLKMIAPQLKFGECWNKIIDKITQEFRLKHGPPEPLIMTSSL